jgi:hypothetical protein
MNAAEIQSEFGAVYGENTWSEECVIQWRRMKNAVFWDVTPCGSYKNYTA